MNGKDIEEWMKFHSPLDGFVESGKGRDGKLAESMKGDRDGNLVESEIVVVFFGIRPNHMERQSWDTFMSASGYAVQ